MSDTVQVTVKIPVTTDVTAQGLLRAVRSALRDYTTVNTHLREGFRQALAAPEAVQCASDGTPKDWTPLQELYHEVAHLKEQMQRIYPRVRKLEDGDTALLLHLSEQSDDAQERLAKLEDASINIKELDYLDVQVEKVNKFIKAYDAWSKAYSSPATTRDVIPLLEAVNKARAALKD